MALRFKAGWYPRSMLSFGYNFVTCRSFAWATSRRVVDSLASAASLVWLTNCRVVLSLSAIVAADKPLVISVQTVFCFWLSGEDNEQYDPILTSK